MRKFSNLKSSQGRAGGQGSVKAKLQTAELAPSLSPLKANSTRPSVSPSNAYQTPKTATSSVAPSVASEPPLNIHYRLASSDAKQSKTSAFTRTAVLASLVASFSFASFALGSILSDASPDSQTVSLAPKQELTVLPSIPSSKLPTSKLESDRLEMLRLASLIDSSEEVSADDAYRLAQLVLSLKAR
jgi:hypothetical protein